jgi:hypothetical protein
MDSMQAIAEHIGVSRMTVSRAVSESAAPLDSQWCTYRSAGSRRPSRRAECCGRRPRPALSGIVILFEIRTLRPYRYYYISIFFNVLQLL